MDSRYQECLDALRAGEKDEALVIFANSDLEIKLNIIFTILVYIDTIDDVRES